MSDTQSEFSPEKPSKKQIRSKSQAKSAKDNKQSKNLPQKKAGKGAKKEKKEKPQKANEKQPKKKKQSKAKNEAQQGEAKGVVFDYMQKQNRPYNLLNVFDNLHGKIKKPVLEVVLNELYEEGKLSCKQFGKNKVYFLNQDRLSVSKQAVDKLALNYNQMRAEEIELSEDYKKSMDDLKKLLVKKTVSEIKEIIAKTEQNIKRLTQKREKLMHLGSQKVDEKEVEKIEKEQVQLRKELNKRRKMTKECLSIWSEITQKKIAEVAEMMGVEL